MCAPNGGKRQCTHEDKTLGFIERGAALALGLYSVKHHRRPRAHFGLSAQESGLQILLGNQWV